MKTSARSLLISAALVIGANGLMASPASNSWFDEWYRTKFGRSSPMEEARQRAEQANTAYREEASREAASITDAWREQFFKAKFGRYSPIEEARQRSERENTAYREETTSTATTPANDWIQQWHKSKFGRSPER